MPWLRRGNSIDLFCHQNTFSVSQIRWHWQLSPRQRLERACFIFRVCVCLFRMRCVKSKRRRSLSICQFTGLLWSEVIAKFGGVFFVFFPCFTSLYWSVLINLWRKAFWYLLLINIIERIKMNVVYWWNVFVTVAIVFIGSVQSVLNDFNSSYAVGATVNGTVSGDDKKVLSRRRRYVAFPEGSSFSVCMPMQTWIYMTDEGF